MKEIEILKKEKVVLDNNVYDKKEVFEACMEYFNENDLASEAWMNKYAMKNKEGKYCEKTPKDTHKRMSKEFAKIENKYDCNLNGTQESLSEYGKRRKKLDEEKIFNYFDKFKYIIPQGSVMSVLGNPYIIGSLSNCIVLPELYDSYGGVCFADQQLVQLMKRRCGVGLSISSLRPENAEVSNAAGTSTGAISFMERFSNTTREVAQEGRRGALMISIDIQHPDVEKFITIKQDLKKITGANISVQISDDFMEAVHKNKNYTHRWPINSENPKVTKTVKARDLWNKIIESAHKVAEPGILFWDRHHWYSTSSIYPEYRNISTNPCGEIPQGNDSCRLVSLNMFECVKHPFTKEAEFDFEKWYEIAYEGQRINDDLVELELETIERMLKKIEEDPEPDYIKQIEIKTWKDLYNAGKNGRRTGLGFLALADTIAALSVKFDSNKSLQIVEEIMKTKCRGEFDSSIDMAIERGIFEGFDEKIENTSEFVQMLQKELPEVYNRMMKHGRRNVSLSTVAPTGTMSLIAQTSSGVEPVFELSYKRRRKINPNDKNIKVDFIDDLGDRWQEYDVIHPKVKMWKEITGKDNIEESPWFGATAEKIDWLKRIKMQSVIQKYTTHSISSTINLPEDTPVETVSEIYQKSWKHGLKGITVYRAGSRSGVMISNEEKVKLKRKKFFEENNAPKRPKILEAEVIRFFNDKEKWIGFVGTLEDRPYEIFTGRFDNFPLPGYVESGQIKKSKIIDLKGNKISKYDFIFIDKNKEEVILENLNKSFNPDYWNYAKMISGTLRHGMPLPYVVDLISGLNLGEEALNTWKVGVIRTIKKYIKDGTQAKDTLCPNCKDENGLIYEEGCLKCKSCGWSQCG